MIWTVTKIDRDECAFWLGDCPVAWPFNPREEPLVDLEMIVEAPSVEAAAERVREASRR